LDLGGYLAEERVQGGEEAIQWLQVFDAYHWIVDLVGVKVGGVTIEGVIPMDAVIDTGTSLNYVPSAYSDQFFDLLLKDINYNQAGSLYLVYCSDRDKLKPVNLTIGDQEIQVKVQSYL